MSSEPVIRVAFFLAVFVVVAAWEAMAPRRTHQLPRRARWPANLGIVALNTVLVRLLLPTTAVAFALLGEQRGWGLLNAIDLPRGAAIVLAVLALDLAIYLQHVLFHAVPLLWRLHRMHHADLDIDVTTGARFHPIEIVASMVLKLAAIAALGAPAEAVLVFEILLNATAMFNHANLRLSEGLDRVLRWFIVTPDMHRIHHSTDVRETNSNYGFNVPWWDRLFGTYCPHPALGQTGMKIGLEHLGPPVCLNLFMMLRFPFVTQLGRHASRAQS